MNFILELPPTKFIALIEKAYEKERDEKLYQQWLVELPYMDKVTPFPKYKEIMLKPKKKRTDDEIIEDAQNVLRQYAKKKGGD